MSRNNAKGSTTERLYEYLEGQLKLQGEKLPCTKDALLLYSEYPWADINYLDFINLDNKSFFEALYLVSFNRSVPQTLRDNWNEQIETLDRKTFQEKYINYFINRRRFDTGHVKLRNCICEIKQYDLKYFNGNFQTSFKERVYQKLHPIYMKMPIKLRLIFKKTFRRYFFVD